MVLSCQVLLGWQDYGNSCLEHPARLQLPLLLHSGLLLLCLLTLCQSA